MCQLPRTQFHHSIADAPPPSEASWLSYMIYKIPFQSVLYLYF